MASYAGAEIAIHDRLVANWTTTAITYENKVPTDWPPTDADGILQPWAHLEITCIGSRIVGQGVPGNHVYHYDGLIEVHVFVPVGTEATIAKGYADEIGEIFRRKQFYDTVTPGCRIRTEDPFPAAGGAKSDDGNYYGVTMTCGFVYWHRG